MQTAIIALTVASVVLPIIGLGKLYALARAEARALDAAESDTGGLSYARLKVLGELMHARTAKGPRNVLVDFALIGGGIIAGGVASILGALC